MALRITIDIFSGRPNPVVTVTGPEERELLERLGLSRKGSAAARRGKAPPLPQSTLGYRGLVIEAIGSPKQSRGAATELPSRYHVANGFVHGPRGATPTRDPLFEEFVCGSTGPFRVAGLDRHFFDICAGEIERFREIVVKWPWKRWPWPLRHSCACAPLWEPLWWNDSGQVQFNNNCYNYGTNYRSDTYAQPGLANGAMYNAITCPQVRAGAVADALIASPAANNKCPKEGHLVALVVGPNWDFHWYRKGRNGYWTHKPGGTQATQVDNSGNLIPDPRTADRGNYTDFCTFMVVMHGHVKIR
jgi:hypothetical protein